MIGKTIYIKELDISAEIIDDWFDKDLTRYVVVSQDGELHIVFQYEGSEEFTISVLELLYPT